MFTGLIETTGSVTFLKRTGQGFRLSVRPSRALELKPGDSISVNGVCLTATNEGDTLSFDVSPETVRSTNLGDLKAGGKVNLERALRLSDRLGGHIVTGHVDGTGTITGRREAGEYTFYSFRSSGDVMRYVVRKGSIAVDGISLTVVDVEASDFSIAIIPHTLAETNIGDRKVGDRVNLETDIIGKYVEKFVSPAADGNSLMTLLHNKGFVNE